jgi:hypothetical protein
MPKFIIEIEMDGIENNIEYENICKDFIEEQLGSASSLKVIKYNDENICHWQLFHREINDMDSYYYSTSCHYDFDYFINSIEENKFKYCPYCGGKIEEVFIDDEKFEQQIFPNIDDDKEDNFTEHLTTDPNHPKLGYGSDDKPVPQNEVYLILSEEERKKGFIRPYRDIYRHLDCGHTTIMGRELSETYARDPKFYGNTYCFHCQKHRPVSEFVWEGTTEKVGS